MSSLHWLRIALGMIINDICTTLTFPLKLLSTSGEKITPWRTDNFTDLSFLKWTCSSLSLSNPVWIQNSLSPSFSRTLVGTETILASKSKGEFIKRLLRLRELRAG